MIYLILIALLWLALGAYGGYRLLGHCDLFRTISIGDIILAFFFPVVGPFIFILWDEMGFIQGKFGPWKNPLHKEEK